MLVVMRLEAHDVRPQISMKARPQHAFHQLFHAIPDMPGDDFDRQEGHSQFSPHKIGAGGDVQGRVDQGAIEVEEERADASWIESAHKG
jgi:hypothetical protein